MIGAGSIPGVYRGRRSSDREIDGAVALDFDEFVPVISVMAGLVFSDLRGDPLCPCQSGTQGFPGRIRLMETAMSRSLGLLVLSSRTINSLC